MRINTELNSSGGNNYSFPTDDICIERDTRSRLRIDRFYHTTNRQQPEVGATPFKIEYSTRIGVKVIVENEDGHEKIFIDNNNDNGLADLSEFLQSRI